ncbi:MAG TPA: hypothetical protein PKK90_00020, partial [Anaerolineaceae bacterium]|nr:hypothetical protein [Anaerolineaceae bacterium]
MNKNKRSVALVVLLVLSLLAGGVQRPVAAIPTALPASPVDESKVPHYYGPYPNWALSPLTTADVAVEIVGDGSGATASATVGANGALTGIQITNPGRGYTTASVNIIGAGTGALADAVLTSSGAVVAITVDASGSGYRIPVVTITGGGATTDATATPYGGVDSLVLTNPGLGYTMPTVDFDMPDDPAGTKAKAHVTWDTNTGVIT